MKKRYKILLFFSVVFVSFFLIGKCQPQLLCNLYEEYINTSFDGIVSRKFLDPKQHSFPYVYIRQKKTDSIEKLELFNDISSSKKRQSMVQLRTRLCLFDKFLNCRNCIRKYPNLPYLRFC